jgi:hypothetical protein
MGESGIWGGSGGQGLAVGGYAGSLRPRRVQELRRLWTALPVPTRSSAARRLAVLCSHVIPEQVRPHSLISTHNSGRGHGGWFSRVLIWG